MFRWLFSYFNPHRIGNRRQVERALAGDADTSDLLRVYMLYIVFPLWLLVGLLDYAEHRKSHIEDTAGTRESIIHSLMLIAAGSPVLLGLFLEMNSLVLSIMTAGFVAHDLLSIVDGYYAIPRREFTGAEQHIHSYMESLPFLAVCVAALLYWKQFLAIFGKGPEKARWKLEPKRRPLTWKYLAGMSRRLVYLVFCPMPRNSCAVIGRRSDVHSGKSHNSRGRPGLRRVELRLEKFRRMSPSRHSSAQLHV